MHSSEHAHRYACWTAARAASASRFSNTEVEYFIASIDLRLRVVDLSNRKRLSDTYFRVWFKTITSDLQNHMRRERKLLTAAKIISIYIKTYEVLPSKGMSPLSLVAYPPIDRYLLTELKKILPSIQSTS